MPKAKVTFEDIGETIEVPVGTKLEAISENTETGIVYGCRQCSCGTCMTEVVDGEENLEPASVLEFNVLDFHGASANTRLACQAKIIGDVTLRPLTLDETRD